MWSWRRVLAPATGSRYASFLYPIKNAEAFNKGEIADSTQVGLAAPDDSTFVVTLRAPDRLLPRAHRLLHDAAGAAPRRSRSSATAGTSPKNIVSNGPFRIVEWRQKDRFVLVPNERYWDRANVRLTKIVALPIEENSTSTNLYKAGVIDWQPSGYVPTQVIPFIRTTRTSRAAR